MPGLQADGVASQQSLRTEIFEMKAVDAALYSLGYWKCSRSRILTRTRLISLPGFGNRSPHGNPLGRHSQPSSRTLDPITAMTQSDSRLWSGPILSLFDTTLSTTTTD